MIYNPLVQLLLDKEIITEKEIEEYEAKAMRQYFEMANQLEEIEKERSVTNKIKRLFKWVVS